jgi:hypothetical protein
LQASAKLLPCAICTSICRRLATICSALQFLRLAISGSFGSGQLFQSTRPKSSRSGHSRQDFHAVPLSDGAVAAVTGFDEHPTLVAESIRAHPLMRLNKLVLTPWFDADLHDIERGHDRLLIAGEIRAPEGFDASDLIAILRTIYLT